MTEYERGYRDALEAAAKDIESMATRRFTKDMREMLKLGAKSIRALAIRVHSAPYDEALVDMLLTALSQSVGWEEGDSESAVLDIIAALRDAGVLR